MAGSFYHLWLAERGFPLAFGNKGDTDELKAAFAAGSIGPDIGFFPGGPRIFSQRVHLERCGDFLRQLTRRATSDVERAFVAGWGLHVYTDMAVHPWVEASVDALLRRGILPAHSDLWHMRLEWGVDCRLLAGESTALLWRPKVLFPRRGDGRSLLGDVGGDFYGGDAGEEALARGEVATARWLKRIPKILWWGGHIRVAGRIPNPIMAFVFARLGRKVVGEWLERWSYFGDGAALARPILPTDEAWSRVVGLGESALEWFCQGWQEGFAHLGNADLYRGEVGDD